MRLREAAARDLEEALRRAREAGALPSVPAPPVRVEAPGEPALGDLSSNLAPAWARAAGMPPRELAGRLLEHLPSSELFQEVRIEGPGFLNFFLSARGLQEVVRDILERGPACVRTASQRDVAVPLSPSGPLASPGPLSLARARQALILEARARLLEAAGHPGHRDGAPASVGPADLVEEVGAPVVRFLLLERAGEPDLSVARDPTRANPAVRVLSVSPRVDGLLRMAADQGAQPSDVEGLGTPPERALIRNLEELPWAVRAAARRGEPHLLAGWALPVAGRFHGWYEREPLLGAPILPARLALAQAVQVAVEAALLVLGIRD